MSGFELSQGAHQRQELLLQPKMLQAIEVLQLPGADLEAFLRTQATENEALCLEEPAAPAERYAHPLERGSYGSPGARGTAEDSRRRDAWLESQPAAEGGIGERVAEQLALLDVSGEELAWAHLVASALDENGYLSASDEALLALAEERGLAPDCGRLGEAIGRVQGLEPRGIGGRDAVEALLLQLDPGEPDYALLCRLLEDLLEEVAKNKLPAVAHELGVDLEHLGELLDRLRDLQLRPAAGLSEVTSPPIRPDVIIEVDGEDFEVRIDGSGLPVVTIDEEVRALARDRTQARELRGYLRDKLERARWVVDAVEQRQRTLQRIAVRVFELQRGFLRSGQRALVPLTMNRVADELGLHVSTVSRAVAGKYVVTPWGTLPLRGFFQGSAGGDETVVRQNVRDLVGEVIAGEDPGAPLSDEEVVRVLAERGVELARRTVAKYRQELGLASSYRRRRWTDSG